MDELEGVIILSAEDSRNILVNSSRASKQADNSRESALITQHVLITAGNKGILRFYQFEIKVNE